MNNNDLSNNLLLAEPDTVISFLYESKNKHKKKKKTRKSSLRYRLIRVDYIEGHHIYGVDLETDETRRFNAFRASEITKVAEGNQQVRLRKHIVEDFIKLNSTDISFLLKQINKDIDLIEYNQNIDGFILKEKVCGSKEIHRLKNSQVYLCGSIDACPDGGKSWRDEITPQLKAIGIQVFDPLKKPINIGLECDDSRIDRKILKENGGFDEFSKLMRTIRHADLRMVDKSDFMIVCLDLDIVFCGTMEEIVSANSCKKPILIFCKQGKLAIPDWIYGMLPHSHLFSTIEEILGYLNYVDSSAQPEDFGRWIFFTNE